MLVRFYYTLIVLFIYTRLKLFPAVPDLYDDPSVPGSVVRALQVSLSPPEPALCYRLCLARLDRLFTAAVLHR